MCTGVHQSYREYGRSNSKRTGTSQTPEEVSGGESCIDKKLFPVRMQIILCIISKMGKVIGTKSRDTLSNAF